VLAACIGPGATFIDRALKDQSDFAGLAAILEFWRCVRVPARTCALTDFVLYQQFVEAVCLPQVSLNRWIPAIL